jgi:FkbM family methyltransferase
MNQPAAAGIERPQLRPQRQRWRVPLHPLVEAAARVCFAYARDQYGVRRQRPLPRYLARSAYFLLAAAVSPRLEAQMSGLRVVLDTADRTIARSIFASGDWDPLLVGTVFEALDLWGHPYRGRSMLEVGANFGVYSLPAVAEYGFAQAIAYEPEPHAFALLANNIARNRLGDRVRALQVALSRAPGNVTLSRGSTNAGDNRVVAGHSNSSDADHVVVRASTLDEELAAGVFDLSEVGLVWLDVQGHEADVLAGARSLLSSEVPLVVEYSTSMMPPASRHLLNEMIADNYTALVDLGWSALTGRIRFQPAWAIRQLVPPDRAIETDLLVL